MRKLAFAKPPESDRLIGFTIPKAGTFHVCDHDEVWCVTLGPTPTLTLTDHAPYSFVRGRTDFLGLVLRGETPNPPLLRAGRTEITCDVDPKRDFATVHFSVVESSGVDKTGQIRFPTFSGDWFAACLSDDGQYLILAEPYDLAIYAVP